MLLSPTINVPISQSTQPQVIQEPAIPVLDVHHSGSWFAVFIYFLEMVECPKNRRQMFPKIPKTHATDYQPDEDQLYRNLSLACKDNQATNAHRYLFLWANARFNTGSLQTLQKRLKRDDLNDEIRKLESVLYTSDGEQDWRGADLLKLVEELKGQKDESVSRRNLLSELNPH